MPLVPSSPCPSALRGRLQRYTGRPQALDPNRLCTDSPPDRFSEASTLTQGHSGQGHGGGDIPSGKQGSCTASPGLCHSPQGPSALPLLSQDHQAARASSSPSFKGQDKSLLPSSLLRFCLNLTLKRCLH